VPVSHEFAGRVSGWDLGRSVSQFAYASSVSLLGVQLYRVGRHEEAVDAVLLCFEAPEVTEMSRIQQISFAARPLAALGRYEEALDIIETDFGPMLDAQHDNLRRFQLLGLTIVLDSLDQIERRDRLAAISLKLPPPTVNIVVILVEILGSEEAVAAFPEPDKTDLTADRIAKLIEDIITEIRDVIARRAPVPLAEAPTKTV
jgi:hypothetical protein